MRRLLRVYVDETGDRGISAKASPFFAFSAVLVADEDEPHLRAALNQLRTDLSVPAGKALHWNEHAKTYSSRRHITRVLQAVSGIAVVYVIVDKSAIPANAAMRTDQVVFYNYAAGLVLERALLAARDWPDGSRTAVVRFGHVRGFDHCTTQAYFVQKSRQASNVPWLLLSGSVHFDSQANWLGLQAADMYAGMLHAACRPDCFGNYEEHHLLAVRHQLRRNPTGSSWGWGFKVLGTPATFRRLPWWPACDL
jgi:Protein of unknown function (DUF3800)